MTTLVSSVGVTWLRLGLVASLVVLVGGFVTTTATAAEEDEDEVAKEDFDLSGAVNLNGLRFNYSQLPAKFRGDITKNGNKYYDKQSYWDATGRTSLMWVLPASELDETGGFVVGLEAGTNHFVIDSGTLDPHFDLRCWFASVHAGIGWMLSEHLDLEITPFIGAGVAYLDSFSNNGTYFELGMRVGSFYTFTNKWQIGVNAFYMGSWMHLKYTENNQKVDGKIRSDGLAFGGGVGYHF